MNFLPLSVRMIEGCPPTLADLVEQAGKVLAADRVFRRHGDGLVGGVVDVGQALERAARSHPIEDEVHRPHLVGSPRSDQRLPVGQRDLFATTAAYLDFLKRIPSRHPLVIHPLPGLTQLQIDHRRPLATMPLGHRHDFLAQVGIAIRPWPVAQRRRTHPHHLATSRCGHHFF